MMISTSALPPRKAIPVGWLLCLAGVLLALAGCKTQPTPPTAAEMQSAFAWFDTLGFPDLAGLQYVRVASGHCLRSINEESNYYFNAFLLNAQGETFTLLKPDLMTSTFTKTPPGTEECERVDYEKLDLSREVTAQLEELAQLRSNGKRIWENHLSYRLGVHAILLVFARACAANGLNDLAYQAYLSAAELPNAATGEPETKPLRQILEDELAYAMIWRNVEDFGDIAVSRQKLLTRFDEFMRRFPDSQFAILAEGTAMLLRQMVHEDETHAQQNSSLETITLDERVAELIFQLRDQNGHQYSQPGRCDIFADERGENSPAAKLVTLGYPAIPQLISAIDDQRFTRSVDFQRNFFFSHDVVRVGDAALTIIERIAGRSFYVPPAPNAKRTKAEKIAAAKVEVIKWWHEAEAKGEKQTLIDAVEAGDENVERQADVLIDRYPDVALEAISVGLRHATDRNHAGLVIALTKIKAEQATALLVSIANDCPYLYSRVIAAQALQQRGRSEGITAMIKAWRHLRVSKPDESTDRETLAEFLATSGNPTAVRALKEGLNKLPIDARVEVISLMRMERCEGSTFRSIGDCQSPELATAVEELLIRALDDTAEYSASGSWNNKNYYEPRLCDLTGYVLALRWPDRYSFDLEATLIQRDRQIVGLKNVWRKAQGLAPLPVPELPSVAPVADEIIRPLLEQIVRSPDGEGPQVVREIESLGIGALRPVQEQLNDLGSDHPARSTLTVLATRLANTVREITIKPDSVPLQGKIKAQLETLQGQPLTSNALVDLLLNVTRELSPDTTGIVIRAERADDGTGFALRVRLLNSLSMSHLLQEGGNYSFYVAIDNVTSYGMSRHPSIAGSQTEETYADLRKALVQALETPPEKTVLVKLSVNKEQ